MLKQVRQSIIKALWEKYRTNCAQAQLIETGLRQQGIAHFSLDHFAIIDLPGAHSGIPHLQELFSSLGFTLRGKDYLPSKQNDFAWLAEHDSAKHLAVNVQPQIVIADFRLDEMPAEIKIIIEKYSAQIKPEPLYEIKKLVTLASKGDAAATTKLKLDVLHYLTGRDWPLPTVKEFATVNEFNELLAWVLVFGRCPNHFTLSVHLLNQFSSLAQFNQFIENQLAIPLNTDGGVIKGGERAGIAQSSTKGELKKTRLADGDIEIPTDFVEFVWRYPVTAIRKPAYWQDYFTGFVAQHADHVIESLYV